MCYYIFYSLSVLDGPSRNQLSPSRLCSPVHIVAPYNPYHTIQSPRPVCPIVPVLPLKRTRLDLEPARSGSCSPSSHRRTIQSVPYYPIPASCVSHIPCTAPLQRRPRRVWIRTRPAPSTIRGPVPTKSSSCSPCSYRRTTQPLPYYPIPASPVSYSPCAERRPRGLCTGTTTTSTRSIYSYMDKTLYIYMCRHYSCVFHISVLTLK